MIIYIYGKDSYRRLRKTQDILADHRARAATGAIRAFDLAEEGAAAAFRSETSSRSLFQSSAIVILRNVFLDTVAADERVQVKKRLEVLAEDPKTFVLCSEESAPPKGWAFLMKPPARAQECAPLSGDAFVSFVAEELNRIGADTSVPVGVIRSVARATEPNSWDALAALAPLAFASAERSERELLAHTGVREEPNAFRLAFSLLRQPLAGRIHTLESLLARGEDPAKLFHLVAYQRGMPERCAAYDASIKTGGLEYEEALTALLLL